MINQVSLRKIRLFLRDYWSSLVTMISIVVLIVLISISYKSFKEALSQRDLLSNEVSLLKNRNDTLTYNKSLTANEIETYNKILSTLIPETEDYFSIIYALEKISERTAFKIVGYTVNLNKTSPEKISINIEGKGGADDFLNFLDHYEFDGARLVTSEKIEYSGGGLTNTKVALNFYNKRYAFGQTVVPQLTKDDIAQLEDIKSKIQVSFTDAASQEDQEYETKSNPF